jgi:hypothetical protein
MSAVAIQQMADRVAGLLEERLNLRGRDLSVKLRRSGRQLPKKVRESAKVLAIAAEKSHHPKLIGQIDMGEVANAYDVCVRHLMTIDPVGRRRDTIAGVIGSVGIGVLALLLGIIALLAWRGYL